MALENYVPTVWIDDSVPAINAPNLNNLESGIDRVTDAVIALELEPAPAPGMPVGGVVIFAGASTPIDHLVCDGSLYNRNTYAELFTAIGTTYGAGDGSTTFNVPDIRGQFIRGLDEGANIDPGRTLGSIQEDEFKSHTHELNQTVFSTNTGSAGPLSLDNRCTIIPIDDTQSTGGTETRPKNIAMRYIIRVR